MNPPIVNVHSGGVFTSVVSIVGVDAATMG